MPRPSTDANTSTIKSPTITRDPEKAPGQRKSPPGTSTKRTQAQPKAPSLMTHHKTEARAQLLSIPVNMRLGT
jgi:hypothetical protein